MTVLSVNVNKIAVLRNSRGGTLPCVQQAARVAIEAGAGGITVHPRPDLRHIRPDDVRALASWLPVELNIEGNPFAPANERGYPGLMDLAAELRPAQCTLVPDSDGQITSDHGFDLERDASRLDPLVARLHALGIRVSLFVDPDDLAVERAASIGADRVEIYTGPYASAYTAGSPEQAVANCAATARRAQAAGLGVNAGHDLDQANLGLFLARVPDVLEVSIGHALIGEALYDGLWQTVRNYRRIVDRAPGERTASSSGTGVVC
jgi:pyridoxine 5-phosphate synthase